MTQVNKNDVNQIFASNAPDQDKPPSFENYTNGWGESRSNNGKPTIKQLNFIQQRTDQNLLWIHQNGGALPYDESIEYADGVIVLKDGRISKLADGSWVDVLKSENPTALPSYYDSSIKYQVGSRIMLDDNSGFVVSTIANNSNNPNSNMSGWFNTLASSNLINSVDDLESVPKVNGLTVELKGYHAGSTLGGSTRYYDSSRASENDGFICINGWVLQLLDYTLIPEQAGAIGDGVADDTAALQKLLNFPLSNAENSKKYKVIGSGNYAVSTSLIINNYGYGLELNLRAIKAHTLFPIPTNYKTATPLIQIGQVGVGGSMVGLNINCGYVDGVNKATWISIVGFGCGGSTFHAEKLENCVNGIDCVKPLFHSASNRVTGGYWVNGSGIGVNIEKGRYVVEGWIVDVNFIANFNVCGVRGKDAQYLKIIGENDFNGKWTSQITLATNSFDKLAIGDTITDGTNTAIVEAFYEQYKGVYSVLVYEGKDTSSGSKFLAGASITTNAGFSNTIKSIKLPSVDNWYPDIIHDFYGQPFAKCIIDVCYGGGIVGSMLYTSEVSIKSTYDAYGNAINGVSFVNDGASVTIKDSFKDSPLLVYSSNFVAPYAHLNMRTNRIFGQEVYQTLTQGVTTNVFTFGKIGDGTVPIVCESYIVTGSTTNPQVGCVCHIFVSGSDIQVNTIFSNNIDLSKNGMSLTAGQGAVSGAIASLWNIQRIM